MKTLFVFLSLIFSVSFSAIAQDAATLYKEGLKLKEEKKITEAADKFKQATQLRPDYTEALYELGWCRNDLKDYYGALSVLRQVVPVWPSILKCHFELAYAFDKTNSYDSAIYYYNKCLVLKPDYANVYKQLGYIAYQKSDNTTALDHFAKYESFAQTAPTDYLYWYRKGYMQNAAKDYTGSRTSLLKSLESKTDYFNTYLELGFASSKLKEDDKAIEYYKKAIELDPKSHIGYNGIAEVYRDNKKDMAEAINWYKKTLAMNSSERKANFGMGYCLNSSTRYADAIPYLTKAIEMEQTYTAAYVELGYSLYMTGNNTDAMTNLDKALNLNPKNENARYYKGLVYIAQKDKTNAERMVDELQSMNSKNATSLKARIDKM